MKPLIFVFFTAFLLATMNSPAQWNPCRGIEGGDIDDVIFHDSSFYIIASGSGVFKRDLDQQAWSGNILPGAFTKIRGADIGLFCLGYYEFYRSLDNGLTWDQPQSSSSVHDVETLDSIVFITSEEGLLKSFDQGETWANVNPFPNSSYLGIHLFANNHKIVCTNDDRDSLSYSVDYGENWNYIQSIDSVGFLMDAFMKDNELWVSYRLLGSDNTFRICAFDLEANLWKEYDDSMPSNTYAINFYLGENLLKCGTNNGIFHLDPQDSIWISDNNNGLENKYISAVCVAGDSTWAATPVGLFVNSNNSDWIPDNNSLYQRAVTQVFRCGGRLYALSGDKIYYSDSIEDGFEVLNTMGLNTGYEILVTDSAWYAGSSAGFLISLDSGLTWVSYSEGLNGRSARYISMTSGYLFCTTNGLFRTRKDSIAWERVPNNIGNANVWDVSSLNDIVFARVYMGGVFRSDDNGSTFVHVEESGTDTPVMHLEDSTLFMMKDFGPVLSTSGDCNQWDTYMSGFYGYTFLACMDVSDFSNSLIIGGGMVDITLEEYYLEYYEDPQSGDGLDITDNLPSSSYPYISTVYNDNGRLFACPNSNGLYYRDDFWVNIEDDHKYEISQVGQINIYPNPASDRLFFEGTGKNEIIRIRVFNSLGQLLLSRSTADGSLDVSNFEPGLYVIELNSGKTVLRKKIIIN